MPKKNINNNKRGWISLKEYIDESVKGGYETNGRSYRTVNDNPHGKQTGFIADDMVMDEGVGSYPSEELEHDIKEILVELRGYKEFSATKELLKEITFGLKYERNINNQPRWKAKCNVIDNWVNHNLKNYTEKRKMMESVTQGGFQKVHRSARTSDDQPQNAVVGFEDDDQIQFEGEETPKPDSAKKAIQHVVKYINKQGKEEERPYISMETEPLIPKDKSQEKDVDEDWTEREPVKKQFTKYDKQGNKIDADWTIMKPVDKSKEQQPSTEDEPKQDVQESAPPGFEPGEKHWPILKKLKDRYGVDSPKIYKIAWAIHNKMKEGKLKEMSASGAAGGYQSPFAFGKGNQNKSRAMQASRNSGLTPVNESSDNVYNSRANSNDFEEHEKLAHNLRNHIEDVGMSGTSVSHVGQDEVPQEVGQNSVLIDFSDLETPEKYYAYVTATEPHNIHLYSVDDRGNQKNVGTENELSLDEIKHLIMSIGEWVGSQVKNEKVMKPEQPTQPDKPQPSLKEQQRRYTVALLNSMYAKKNSQMGRKKLGENFNNMKKSVDGKTKSIL